MKNRKSRIKKTRHLSGDRIIHQFSGNASNFYIVEDRRQDATFLADCGMPSDAENLIDTLHNLPPLKRIVCTHFHVDHISGWICLKERLTKTEIWFHETSRPFVMGDEAIPFPSYVDFKEMLIPCMKQAGYFPGSGDILGGGLYGTPFKKGFPLDRLLFFATKPSILPGFETIPTPGHRPDAVSFFDPDSGILICGDVLVVINGNLKINTFVANKKDQEDSIDKIKQLNGLKFIFPGHGHIVPFSKGLL